MARSKRPNSGAKASWDRLDSGANFDSREPQRPAYLTGMAAQEWTRVTDELRAKGHLEATDRAVLEQYCVLYARWREAEERSMGRLVLVKDGSAVINPFLEVAHQSLLRMHALLVDLGLARSSRGRPPQRGDDKNAIEDDPLAGLEIVFPARNFTRRRRRKPAPKKSPRTDPPSLGSASA